MCSAAAVPCSAEGGSECTLDASPASVSTCATAWTASLCGLPPAELAAHSASLATLGYALLPPTPAGLALGLLCPLLHEPINERRVGAVVVQPHDHAVLANRGAEVGFECGRDRMQGHGRALGEGE